MAVELGLLDDEQRVEEFGPASAVLLGESHPQEPELRQPRPLLVGKEGARGVPLEGLRPIDLGGNARRLVPYRLLLFGEGEIDHGPSHSREIGLVDPTPPPRRLDAPARCPSIVSASRAIW